MKGIINKGVRESICANYGDACWEKVKQVAGCSELFFAAGCDYPDQTTLDLIDAASEVTGVDSDTLMVEFGKHWIPHTGLKAYPHYYQLAGRNARKFLLNMDRVHQHVTQSVFNARPPRFRFEDGANGSLLIHYYSSRGLCAVLRGLIIGVGLLFEKPLELDEITCARRGDDHCTIEVRFDGA
jgi:predicted hydrocarbon binding protein